MVKEAESHIPVNLRQWLDGQIERELTDCAPLGFHGLMTALTEKTPQDAVQSLDAPAEIPADDRSGELPPGH